MSIATLALAARQSLARGLEALQAMDAPPGLLDVAQPVARAMGALVELERSQEGMPATRIRPVLDSLREGLRLLQLPEHVEHPAAARGMAAVAETLAVLVELVLFLDRVREPFETPAWPGTVLAQPATVKAAVKAQPEGVTAAMPGAPAPASRQPLTQTLAPAAARVEPRVIVLPVEPAQAAPRLARASSPSRPMLPALATRAPKLENPVSTRTVDVSATASAARAPTHAANPLASAALATGMTASVAPRPDTLAQVSARAQLNALLRRDVSTERGLRAIDVALGTHSASNFYTGLTGGGDIVAAGGLFVGTYQVPKVGEQVLLEISMPGGYQFVAKAIVAWTRGGAHSSASLDSLRAPAGAPGFGAQFCEVTDEGRRLIQRYVRNREPLFYDAL